MEAVAEAVAIMPFAAPAASSKSIMDDLLGLSMPTAAAPSPAKQQTSAMDLLSGARGIMRTAVLPRLTSPMPIILTKMMIAVVLFS